MTPADQSNQVDQIETIENMVEDQPTTSNIMPAEDAAAGASHRILIGSQRDPAAYRARQKRDWTPIADGAEKKKKRGERKEERGEKAAGGQVDQAVEAADQKATPALADAPAETFAPATPAPMPETPEPATIESAALSTMDIDAELKLAMGGASMDDLLYGDKIDGEDAELEPDSLQSGRIVAVRRDDVFVEFGRRRQGTLSLRSFDVPPRVGAPVQVTVQRFNPEDGLYELSLPNKAVQVDDWSDLVEGMMIEVRVTGHNAGGLECEVNHIRGFIPVSQISLYRVEDLAQFVDQKMACVITEANPDRRNLVLSRRAVLEREREQAREKMLTSLQPGQTFDGVVRKLMDFGAFVELGNGVDGLIHVSQLAWGRVKHPSEILKEGQLVKVRVDKVDPTTGKISLAYRDLMESPWEGVSQKYPPRSVASGTVTKLMDFGAFVELEPGIEGLVHISELSPKRVWRASDVVKEGDKVEVLILSVDVEAQRLSLSMKALAQPAEPMKKDESAEDAASAKPSRKSNKPTGPLRGGLGKRTGDHFGLKW